jgi:hypothetical protein
MLQQRLGMKGVLMAGLVRQTTMHEWMLAQRIA